MSNPNGYKNLVPEKVWQKGQSGNPGGRPKKFITTLKEQGYNKYEINWTIEILIAMTERELEDVERNPDSTILERIISAALLSSYKKKSLYAIDNLLTRAHGAPKQQIEQTNLNKEFTVTFKKVDPSPIEPTPFIDIPNELPNEGHQPTHNVENSNPPTDTNIGL